MSQRFTVSKSDGERNPSEMQGEVNQLFEGDDPPTCSAAEEEKGVTAGGSQEEEEEVVVVLKGRQTDGHMPASSPRLLAVSYTGWGVRMLDFFYVTPSIDRCDLNF